MPDNDQIIPDYSAINTTTTIYNTAVSAVSNVKDIDNNGTTISTDFTEDFNQALKKQLFTYRDERGGIKWFHG